MPGEFTKASEEVLERDGEWIAPLLWRSEFRNALTTLHPHQGLELSSALAIAGDGELFLHEREFAIASAPVLRLAAESGRSAYDCESRPETAAKICYDLSLKPFAPLEVLGVV